MLVGCGARDHGEGDAGSGQGVLEEASQLARAYALIAPAAPLPSRPEVLSLAQAIEARAVREGAGARATELHALAARLVERVWRVEGREQDAKEAVDLFRSASRDLGVPGACEAAERRAALAGDVAHDGAVSYAELYRVQRIAATLQSKGEGTAPSTCARAIERDLASLEPFRPAARVLEAIDEGLAGEGALIPSGGAFDGGTLSVGIAPKIVRIEEWPGEESARVVVVLDRAARFRAADEGAAGARGSRTFVELDGVDVGTVDRDVPMSGIVTRMRAEATTTGARVALELTGHAYRRVFHLLEPYRIVIDVARHPPGGPSSRGTRAVSRVVLDPGHGGTDPGAIGPAGVKEKDVTLEIAKKVAPVLARQGMQVLLTREDDHFITLEERTARANGYAADLFVSIHCNAAPDHTRRGVETYVLDTSKDEMAGRIAARENATSQAATAELGSILASMRMADQATRSAKLADLLQRAAMASLKTPYPDAQDGGVHTAAFYVLVGARMPGVLFETSYISNPMDEERLASDDYKQRLADGIVNAVKAYREGR
jgi:N-acetylmuramoyl-L-alanine amidase